MLFSFSIFKMNFSQLVPLPANDYLLSALRHSSFARQVEECTTTVMQQKGWGWSQIQRQAGFQACLSLVPGLSQASQRLFRLVPTWFQTGPRLVSGWSQAGPMLSGWSLRAPACSRLLPDMSLVAPQACLRLFRLVLSSSQAAPACPRLLRLVPGCSGLS